MVCDIPELCKFLSIDSCQKRFLWTHKGVDLAPHSVVGLALQGGDSLRHFSQEILSGMPSAAQTLQVAHYIKEHYCEHLLWDAKWQLLCSTNLLP